MSSREPSRRRWPLHQAHFWEEAPLFRPLLCLAAGIVCYDHGFPSGQSWHWMLALAACSALTLAATGFMRIRSSLPDALFACSFLLGYPAIGWCVSAAGDSSLRADWFGHGADTGSLHAVRIIDEPAARAASTRATVAIFARLQKGRIFPASGKALLYRYRSADATPLAKGDTLLLPARWQPVRNSGNPFAFDNVRFQRRKGIRRQQFLPPGAIALLGRRTAAEAAFTERAHHWCNRQLRAYIRDSAAYGLLQAMLLGDESAFDPALREAYAQTGVVHIVSISGSHVAMLFLVVTGLLGWIRGRRGKWIRYGAGVALVWLYVLIAGAPPSALRSAVMFSVVALGIIAGREGQSLNTLAGAAFALLLFEPAWLFSVGFQLSFLAVLSMLLFYKPVYQLWPQQGRLPRMLWQGVSASVAAEILTAPLVVYYFHNFPLLFIIANLLAALLLGICALTGGMAVIALCWVPPVAGAIGKAVGWLVSVFNSFIQCLQQLNPPSFQYLQISMPEMILIYILITALAVLWLNRKRTALLPALMLACLLAALLALDRYRALRQHRLIVYSNGRNARTEIIRGHHYHVVTGPLMPDYNARAAHTGWHAWRQGEAIQVPYLRIGGHKVLVVSDTTLAYGSASLPVDVLVMACPLGGLQPGRILRAFRPRTVVLSIRPGAWQLRHWSDSCTAYRADLHNVSEAGAYILE